MLKRPSAAVLALAGTSIAQVVMLGTALGLLSDLPLDQSLAIVAVSAMLALLGIFFAHSASPGTQDADSLREAALSSTSPEQFESTGAFEEDGDDRTELEARLKEAAIETDRLRDILQILDAALRRLAAGDLSTRIGQSFPDRYEGLRADFNRSVTRFQEPLLAATELAFSLHGTAAEIQSESRTLRAGLAAQTSIISCLATETGRVLEEIRKRDAEIDHIATIGHNAALDLRRHDEGKEAATAALRAVASVTEQMTPVADRIMDIALQTNMAAMQIRITTDRSANDPGDGLRCVADMARLAEQAAEASKAMARLARGAGQAADQGGSKVERLIGELAAAGVYLETLQQRTAALARPDGHMRRELAALRGTVMTLAKTNREHLAHADGLSRKGAELIQGVARLDQETGRLMPVTMVQPNSVFVPPPSLGPKRPPHLRLVKT